MALINYAIMKEWDGKSEKPDWMRNRACVPCDCEECYFCLNKITSGVAHRSRKSKVVLHYNSARSGQSVQTDKCVDVPVKLEKGCHYCKQCMGKMKGKVLLGKDGRNLTFAQKRKLCTFSRMGCPQPSCNEHICDSCWAEGYTKHNTKKSKNE